MKFLSAFLLLITLNISAQAVYKTPSGSKYHLSACRMVKNVSSSLSIEKALKQGLEPCKICKPPFRQGLGIVSMPKKTAGQNSANRCFAITKAGTRCKRNTSIGNNFCFQHLPK